MSIHNVHNGMPWFSASFGYLKKPIDQIENPEQHLMKIDPENPVEISMDAIRKHAQESEYFEMFEPKSYQDITDKMAEIVDQTLTSLGLPTDIEVDLQYNDFGQPEYQIDHPRADEIKSALQKDGLFERIAEFGHNAYMINSAEEARVEVLQNHQGSKDLAIEKIRQSIEEVYAKTFLYDDNGSQIDLFLE